MSDETPRAVKRGWWTAMPKPVELEVADFDDSETSATAVADEGRPVDPAVAAHYGIPAELVRHMHFNKRAEILKPFALRMHCDHYPTNFIARTLNLTIDTVRRWRLSEDWEQKRAEVERKFASAIVMARLKQTMSITCDAIDVIAKVMQETKKKPDLNLKDAEAVSRILQNIDKIVRLSTGSPTDITETRDTTELRLPRNAKELAKILEGDPFIDVTPEPKGDEGK